MQRCVTSQVRHQTVLARLRLQPIMSCQDRHDWMKISGLLGWLKDMLAFDLFSHYGSGKLASCAARLWSSLHHRVAAENSASLSLSELFPWHHLFILPFVFCQQLLSVGMQCCTDLHICVAQTQVFWCCFGHCILINCCRSSVAHVLHGRALISLWPAEP